MARANVATLVVVAMVGLLVPATARAQAQGQSQGQRENGPSERELESVLVAGASTGLVAYLTSVFVAHSEPHSIAAVDGLPVAGAVVASARNAGDRFGAPLLLASAGLQMAGLLMMAAAATEMHEKRSWSVDVSAGRDGCGATLTWHFH
jgi:hypothetical protein